jgi:hypothetical protein
MKQLNLFAALLALTCCAFFSAAVLADDALEDLDVTMIVVDDSSELESSISEMRGPNDDDVHDDDWGDEESDDEAEEHESDHDDDDFRDEESDDDFDRDNEKEEGLYGAQEDLDDGDEVDDDLVEEDD